MLDDLKGSGWLKILIVLAVVTLGLHLLQLTWHFLWNFVDIFVMLLCSWMLSFVLGPICDFFQTKLHTNKVVGTAITYTLVLLIVIAIVVLFLPQVLSQIQVLSTILPNYLSAYPAFVSNFGDYVNVALSNIPSAVPSVAQFLFFVFLAMVIAFYLNIDKEHIESELLKMFPENWHEKIKLVKKVVEDTFGSFLRVQLFVAISLGILSFITLAVLGVEFSAPAALLSGILAFIPLIGAPLSVIPPLLAALISGPVQAIVVVVILFAGQQVVLNIISPKLLGKAFKIHPVVVLISFLVGMQVAGAVGAFLAIPVLGIASVMIRKFGYLALNWGKKRTSLLEKEI